MGRHASEWRINMEQQFSKYSVKGDTIVVEVAKELDHHNSVAIREELDRHIYSGKVKNIIFDFKNTTFMDSSGIGVILGRHRLLKNVGGVIAVTNINKSVDRLLTISGVYKIVEKCGQV